MLSPEMLQSTFELRQRYPVLCSTVRYIYSFLLNEAQVQEVDSPHGLWLLTTYQGLQKDFCVMLGTIDKLDPVLTKLIHDQWTAFLADYRHYYEQQAQRHADALRELQWEQSLSPDSEKE